MCKLITNSIAAILIFSSISLAQWTKKITGLPSWTIAVAMDACNSTTAVISVRPNSGNRQVLYKTTNTGDSWTGLVWPTIDFYEEAEDVSIIDNNHIWFATDNGRIYSTTDGGATWQLQFFDPSKATFMNYIEMFDLNNGVAMGDAANLGELNSIHFISANIGWAVGWELIPNSSSTSNTILKTIDGGYSWTSQTAPDWEWLNSVYFLNENIGWTVGVGGLIFKTVDSGNTWLKQTTPTYGYYNWTDSYRDIYFTDENIGWAVGDAQGTIVKTTNGGEEWLDITGDLNFKFTAVNFIDQNSGCVAGYDKSYVNCVILKTDNGGNEWREVFAEPYYRFNSIHFTDSNEGWAVGYIIEEDNYGIILKSEDGGESWTSKIFNEYFQFNSIYAIKFNVGFGIIIHRVWAVGDNGVVLVSLDGGETWTAQNSGVPNSLKSIHFNDFFNGWICGDNGLILKTSDSGTTWNKVYGETYKPALFLQTTDGGTNWIETNTNSLLNYFSGDMWRRIDFTDMNTGFFWYGGNEGLLNRTTDGGISWTQFNFSDYVTVLKFYNENLGMLYNLDEHTICKTTDGGNTWTNTATIANQWGQDIEFIPGNSDLVWFVGSNTYFSQDGGATWSLELGVRGRDIVFVDENHGWILCDNTFVYYTSNMGGIVTDVNEENNNLPSEFALFQNYPNPFNPTATISYQLSTAGNVTLKVYDLLGNEITTLVDEEKLPGMYSVEFNGEKLSSGIYFYTLQAGKFRDTKKLMLLK